ncbi:MAG: hypothetical protein QM778_07220 [Myxococcales bacterium]
MKLHVLAALALSALASCGSDDLGTGVEEPDCPKGSTLTYAENIQPFMAEYCTSCHSASVPESQRDGAPTNLNFDTEAEIIANTTGIIKQAAAGPGFKNTKMPEGDGPKPSNDERKMLGEWLACQAE